MKKIRISIIGNSVAIRNRPPEEFPNNKNYGVLLEEMLQREYSEYFVSVTNKSFSRATIVNIIQNYDDFVASMPDYFIINIGVSDASTREIPFWFAEILKSKKQSWIKNLFLAFHNYCIKPYRRFFVKLRRKKSWISKIKFEKYYRELILILQKETNARIITIPINPANERVEKSIPGSTKNYLQYNKLIKRISNEYKCIELELDDMKCKTHYPDGIHYSLQGNKLIAQKLFTLIKKDNINDKQT